MYHMAMPPHFGGAAHPSVMNPSIFPGPLLPPGNHGQTIHQYSHQSPIDKSAGPILHASSSGHDIAKGSNVYHQQPSAYVYPYLQHHPANVHTSTNMASHHIQHVPQMPLHPHLHGFPTQNPGGNLVIMSTANHPSRPQDYSFNQDQRQPLSVDEELMEDITTSHLGYLETEDSPHKMEQREKLENLIMEYLSITPHTHKFMFHQVLNVLEQSINTRSNFIAHEAACAFDALAHYAANLISQPWRREFREIKLYNGFWVHQVSSHLVGAESILELIGYTCVDDSKMKKSSENPQISRNHYVMDGVLDPDLISRLALDCMIAYCELQCLNRIKEGVSDYGLSWSQILQFRQMYVGGIDITARQLLFTLRQRLPVPLAHSPAQTPTSPDPASPPPIPARQMKHSAENIGGKVESFEISPRAEVLGDDNALKMTTSHNLSADNIGFLRKSRPSSDLHDEGGPSSNRCSSNYSSSRVPTAKLIDLDSSLENLPHSHCKSRHLLPKVLPQKTTPKSSSHLHRSLPTEPEDLSPPPSEPPMEVFQSGTLEEHLEATLNLVKNPIHSNTNVRDNPDRNSLESWEFVFRGLEKKGYTKDIGDRGDILNNISHQKINFTSDVINNDARSFRNVNLDNQQSKKDSVKSRPLTINRALQQITLNENRECIDNNSSAGNSHVRESHKRSIYDNVSGGGFETAPQSSSDDFDTAAERRLPNPLRKINNAARTDNTNSSPSSAESFRNYLAAKKRESATNATEAVKNFGSSTNNSCSSGRRSTTTAGPPAPLRCTEDAIDGAINTGTCNRSSKNEISRPSTWGCITCTFINASSLNVCEMCGKSRDPGPDSKPLVSGGKQCPVCTLINDRDLSDCSACGADLKGSSTYI